MPKLTLQTPIENLYMVGENYAEKLHTLGIFTVRDFLYHFPFRWEDLSSQKKIAELTPGETVTLTGEILSIQNIYSKNGKKIQKAIFTDGEQNLEITWFNQPFLLKNLKPGTRVNLAGKVAYFGRKLTITSPSYEIIKNNYGTTSLFTKTTHTGKLVAVYPETLGLSSKWLRSRMATLIKQLDYLIEDFLPEEIRQKEKLLKLSEALTKIHCPENWQDIEQAKKRLSFDEMLILNLKSLQRKQEWQQQTLRHQFSSQIEDLKPFLQKLPFKLTKDQEKALQEIINDLNEVKVMNRLLQGDVGSGKTVVAAACVYLAFRNKLKTVLMTPTEVLAHQHYESLKKLLEPLKIKIGFFTGSDKSKESLEKYDLYLGTHALLFQNLPHEQIGLVIIDEQHRFGVEQRAKLLGKDKIPHLLTMTATPIPRTIALTLYGDLALSIIKEMPKGRKTIKTWVIPELKRNDAYNWIKKEIGQNQSQVYLICPLIEESDKAMMKTIKAATVEYEKICQIFPEFKIGLLHGKIKAKEKNEIMANFAKNKIQILVSTSVIEVGIDVANATIIIIEGAERFGLSQLHQLRGRVGRGEKQSYCLLFPSTNQNEENKRLKAMETTQSGIELAELDLKLRGPGELYGTLQSGFLDLKIASLNDYNLINLTQIYAKKILTNWENYQLLHKELNHCKIANIKPN
ncbi:ATP-dependent DNA helicase RecG [Candidatus Beckwithbacteria bacterium]|nr:ATP-dependent DNA helicase RecG [Candidatus Beckwithbacteria bacterium]